ncbi:EF hand domain-containing protein [Rhizobium sp. PP-F2F-G48]|uniref:EF-hand domain-containing protein n=1 Tax=Rhizobium sp. PP-F2F-G48 TaxID=2135651 RepID=UPI001052D63D|nr:EF-hand domain-containing protein [Rhizobium sp. PP-F2F-G48]TCM56253.1 EF hand domain-containing protein [Rhizobium sp. PP-F2F-G48]
MTKKTLILGLSAIAIAASSLATPSFAAKHDGPTREQRAAWTVKKLDTDKDGKVSLAEADAAASRVFAAFDADKNGQVTPDEVKAKRDAFKAARAEMRKADKGPERQELRAKLQDMRPVMLPAMGPRMFKRADTDKNGSLSLAEVTAAADKRFKARDSNGDGFIDAADLTRKI